MGKVNKGQRLGRGLGALLPTEDIQSASDTNADKLIGNILELPLDQVTENPYQPRTVFNEETLNELASSIRELGVIQPITVRKIAAQKYELISGERRLRASKLAGLTSIPAFIRIANDEESLMMALVENIQRQDLDPIEVALSYNRMIEELSLTQEQMSDRVGKKRSTITNYLRLLKLDPIIQTGIRDGFISMGHGRALINVEDREEQLAIYNRVIAQNLSVRETEMAVQQLKNPQKVAVIVPKRAKEIPAFAAEGMERLRQHFGNNATIRIDKTGKGKVEIPFKTEEEFKRIQKILYGEG
ncbi:MULTISPECIES: ParB/RepB/Spo0J family partition protein [unclassified Capnocytophaga]|jgi:ParB-like partition proteins|uniref:ParB/RepB/Spo0J family partition protein n=1 Tax=unclassified Capnocytophaga TaxID=2640652 RepID=UPI000202ED53|nr:MULTISPECIES: ParB/RepB/Spo0J family partition protein [unclassified Capnocytophaga]EGD33566.1 chromosome partitioning protein SpoOJ [Capnocytophaga sp. oral taxon 338 str. F0234]MEB3005808.1 ParB/RepB/Spo0J family partition protein [Capnocytophaga sp. G2]